MTVRSFSDTASVSLAYAMSDATTAAELEAVPFHYLPFTTEGFGMSKESVLSTAIRGNRRTKGSKNTRGSAAGAATIEFGGVQFSLDMLQLMFMNVWKSVDPADATKGKYLTDSNLRQFMAVEKTVRPGGLPTDVQYHERFYGVAMNDGTLELADAALITLAGNFIGVFADTAKAPQGADGLGGSVAKAGKSFPADYEIADSSNNLKDIVITNDDGEELEVVFASASLQVQNNVREQNALGSVFASGIGLGKVAVTLTGDIYYYDQTILDVHMDNKRVKASMTIATREGVFTLVLPNLMAQAPTNNAQGENQDYMTSLTLSAEEGTVELGGAEVTCAIAITYVPTPVGP